LKLTTISISLSPARRSVSVKVPQISCVVYYPARLSKLLRLGQLSWLRLPAFSQPPEPSSKAKAKAGNIFDLVTPQDLQTEQNIVGRFLYLLSVLARVHKKDFVKVLEIKGRNRLYFGTSAEALNEAGSSTNPKQIPNTNFWVITNSNTTRKKMMLTETAIKLGYSAEDAERIRDLL
jgi:negative modulator of initiation of replication